MATTRTSRAAWRNFNVTKKELECLHAIEALLAAGQTSVTRNEIDRWWNDRLEAQGEPRRQSPSWGPRLSDLVRKGVLVRVDDRPCAASASREPCQAYTFASEMPTTTSTPRIIQMTATLSGGSSVSARPVVLDEEGRREWAEAEDEAARANGTYVEPTFDFSDSDEWC